MDKKASKIAFLVVLLVFGAFFAWWFRSRPSFLLYQAHSHLGDENQPAVIARYEKLLRKKDLPKEDEVKYRVALAEFYLKASEQMGTVVIRRQEDGMHVSHPYVAKAKAELDRVLELEPNNAAAHYGLGWVLLRRRLIKYAIDELNLALEFEPRYKEALNLLSQIHLEREKPDEAREYAIRALGVDPTYDKARWSLALAYSRLGEHLKSQKEYRLLSESFKQSPEIRSYYSLRLAEQNQWIDAEQEMDKAVRQAPENLWVRINQGSLLAKQGRYQEATGVLIIAEKKFKSSPWPLIGLAEVNAKRGLCELSRKTSNLLVLYLPRWPWAHLTMARTELCEGNDRKVEEELKETLRLAPKFVEARSMLAELYLDKGNYEALGNLIRPWLDDKMNQSVAYAYLAQSFYQQNNLPLTKEMAELSIRLDSQNDWPFVWLGLARVQSKEKEAGIRAIRNSLTLNPFDQTLLGYEALSLALQNQWEGATAIIQQAIKNDPDNATLWKLKGDILKLRKFDPEAVQAYKQAIDYKPYLLGAHLGLIELYWRNGNLDSADITLSQAVQINSKNPAVLKWRKTLIKS